jgi:type I restriction enzyme S subunit
LLKASITDIFRQAPQKGWTEYAFGDLVNNFDGRRVPLKKGDRLDMQGPYSYYGATGVIDHVNQYLFDGEFLLVSEDGANLVVRKYPIAFIASGQFWVNNHAHVVQANDLTTNRYLAYAIEGTNIRQLVTGAAQPKLNQAKLNQISIWLPKTKDEQDYLVHYFDEIELQSKEMLKTSEQNHDLLFIAEKSILAQVFRGEF